MKGLKEVKERYNSQELSQRPKIDYQTPELQFGSNHQSDKQTTVKQLFDGTGDKPKKNILVKKPNRFDMSIMRKGKEAYWVRASLDEDTFFIHKKNIRIEFSKEMRDAIKAGFSSREKEDFSTFVADAMQWARETSKGLPEVCIYTSVRNNEDALNTLKEFGLTPSQISYKIRFDQLQEFAAQSQLEQQKTNRFLNVIERTIQVKEDIYIIEPEKSFREVSKDLLAVYEHDGHINERYRANPIELKKFFKELYDHQKDGEDAWLTLKDAQGERKGMILLNRKGVRLTIELTIYMRPELRGQGVGKCFFLEAMHIALHKLKAKAIRINMLSGNPAQNFYEKHLNLTPYGYIVDQEEHFVIPEEK